jgi:hypothetical protein
MAGHMDALLEYRRKLDAGEVERQPTKTPWEKLRENPTPKRRIAAACCACFGWGEGGEMPPGVKGDIGRCPATSCPLHGARPYQP